MTTSRIEAVCDVIRNGTCKDQLTLSTIIGDPKSAVALIEWLRKDPMLKKPKRRVRRGTGSY